MEEKRLGGMPPVDRDAHERLNLESEESYRNDRDWRALCDSIMAVGRNADPAERSHISRAVFEEIERLTDELEYESQEFDRTYFEGILADERYPSDVRFETLPAYLAEKMPAARGTLDDAEEAHKAKAEALRDRIRSFYGDVCVRRSVIDPGTRMDLGDEYMDYERAYVQEEVRKAAESLRAGLPVVDGFDYSRSIPHEYEKELHRDAERETAASLDEKADESAVDRLKRIFDSIDDYPEGGNGDRYGKDVD